MEKSNKRELGRKSRAAGKRFESKVREDLEKKGWIVFRNTNDVEIEINEDRIKKEIKRQVENAGCKLIGEIEVNPPFKATFKQAKSKWNPFKKCPMMTQSGFPDFIILAGMEPEFEVKFVECKMNGYLDKIEKQKVEWIKTNLKIPVIIASKGKKRGEIEYKEWGAQD